MNREYVCIAVPSIDAGESLIHTDYLQREEVVRCRDCGMRGPDGFCDLIERHVMPDGFCAWGERAER